MGFWYSITSFVGSGILSYVFRREVKPLYTWGLITYILFIGFLAFMTTFLYNKAMGHIPATLCGLLLLLSIPMSQAFDWLLFNKHYTSFEIIGISLIFLSNLVIGILKSKRII